MKRLLILSALLPIAALAQWGNPPASGYSALNTFLQSLIAAQTGTALPATCTAGKDVYLNTTSSTLSYCSATNTWTTLPISVLVPANNLSDLANAATARTNLGLGGAATLNVGAAAGTVAAGNDSRITGAEQSSNKSTSTSLGTSDTLYPSQNAVKSYVDAGLATKAASNAATTVNGQTCALGSTCTITSGIVNLTIGNGSTPDPNAGGVTCTGPSATNLSLYMDNGASQQWFCYATNKWLVYQSSIGSGPYTISGVTGTVTTGLAASRPACSSNAIYFASDTKVLSQCSAVTGQWSTLNGSGQLGVVFDATAGTIQAYDSAGNITTMMKYPAAGIPQSTGTAWGSSLTLDTDGAMAANSNTRVPSQAAAKAYVDTGLAGKAASNAATTVNGQTCTLGSSCTLPLANQLVAVGGTSQTARNRINLIAGSNVTITPSDNAGSNSTDVTIAASGPGSTGVGRATLSATWTAINDGACQEQTATWTGITTADTVILGAPASLNSGVVANGRVSASNTVAIRLCNLSGAAVTPGALSFNGTLAIYNLNGSGTIDFTSIPDGTCQANTFTLTGVSAGDPVAAQWPSSLESGLVGSMLASASNTVQVRLCNWSGAALDPASNTFGASVAK